MPRTEEVRRELQLPACCAGRAPRICPDVTCIVSLFLYTKAKGANRGQAEFYPPLHGICSSQLVVVFARGGAAGAAVRECSSRMLPALKTLSHGSVALQPAVSLTVGDDVL